MPPAGGVVSPARDRRRGPGGAAVRSRHRERHRRSVTVVAGAIAGRLRRTVSSPPVPPAVVRERSRRGSTARGTALGTVGEPGFIESVALSPDGRKLAVTDRRRRAPGQASKSGCTTRERREHAADVRPDGDTPRVVAGWDADRLHLQREGLKLPVSAGGRRHRQRDAPLLTPTHAWVNDWSSDGRWVIISTRAPDRRTTTSGPCP